jgi:uncharacterized protein (DUF2345 family)
MGGVEQVVANDTIYIASVNGNIIITATATQFTPVEGAYIHNDGDLGLVQVIIQLKLQLD